MKRRAAYPALVALTLLALAAGSCGRDDVTEITGLSASREAGTTALRNVILFATDIGFQAKLAVINPDGTGRRLLTTDDHGYLFAAISPDGRQIAFTRFSSDGTEEGLYVMNADASGQSRLVPRSFLFDGEPAWSPDGAQIAFTRLVDGPSGPFGRIFVVNRDGTGLRQLTPDVDPNAYLYDGGASWSPDGTRLVFTRNAALHVINADGTGLTALAGQDFAQNPSWSPDGTRIAYEGGGPGGNISVRDADGSNLVRVSSTEEQQGWPRWSSDGRRIVLNRVVGGQFQLFVINADGSGGETRLSFGGTSDHNPSWSPFPRVRSNAGATVDIAPTIAKLAPSDTRQYTATVHTTSGTVIDHASVQWSSSDAAVATVTSSGLVTAVDNGLAQIRAVFGSDTARAQVRVADRVLRNVIVYSTDEFAFPELAVVKPDGTGRRRLTTDQFGYRSPDVSPDGRRIAFATDFSIFIINADAAGISEGSIMPFFSFNGAFPSAPAWSPDGSQIAFSAVHDGAFGPVRRILVVNADGSGLRQVSPDDPAADDGPTWSPDGSRLIFTRNGVLQVINVDGTGMTPLANEDGSSTPDWSPDGTRVAYESTTPGFGIRIRGADGSNPFTVTSQAGDRNPRWAPDNQRLVFARVVNGKSQLFTVHADGTGETKLSANANASEAAPSWSPLP
jgi:Tol biopolymer transport system component